MSVAQRIGIPRPDRETLAVEWLEPDGYSSWTGVRILTSKDGSWGTAESVYIEPQDVPKLIAALAKISKEADA